MHKVLFLIILPYQRDFSNEDALITVGDKDTREDVLCGNDSFSSMKRAFCPECMHSTPTAHTFGRSVTAGIYFSHNVRQLGWIYCTISKVIVGLKPVGSIFVVM